MGLSVHLRTSSARDAEREHQGRVLLAAPAPTQRRRRHRAVSAQGLVEFAIIGPVFFMMMFGVLDMGRAVWTSHELASGTREGSRYVMVHGTAGTWNGAVPVEARVLDSTSALQGSNLTVSVTGAPGTGGGFATASTCYRFDFIVTQIIGRGSITMTQRSRIVIQS